MAQNGSDYREQRVRDFLEAYTKKISFNPTASVQKLDNAWQKIAAVFFSRLEQLFKISYPSPHITAYLTTNQRCTYNIFENYFFVNFSSKSPSRTIMHELFHFYTWHAFHADLVAAGINEDQYNDVKESLTVLLNTEFVDLMEGAQDDGYPQHVEMRKMVQELWQNTKDLRKVVFGVFSI